MRVEVRTRRLALVLPTALLAFGGTVYQASNTIAPSHAGQSTLTISQPTSTTAGNDAKLNIAQAGKRGYYQFIDLSASLLADARPVEGAALTFTAAGVTVCVANTDAHGVARCPSSVRISTTDFPGGRPAGYVATYAGAGALAPSFDAVNFGAVVGAGNQ